MENNKTGFKKLKKLGYTGMSCYYGGRLVIRFVLWEAKKMLNIFATIGKFLHGLIWYFIGAVAVAYFVETVKRKLFSAIDADAELAAKYATKKIITCTVIAAVMSFWVLICLFNANACVFVGGKAFLPFYAMAFFLLQMAVDLGVVKKIWNKIKEKIENRPKRKKMRKVVTYVEEDGAATN